jgi:two-component system, chemotaxis family, chemotaxis protein CheY
MSHLVLVVDDDAAIRMVTADVLRADGQEVRCASDGTQALAAMRCGPLPELVLLDLMMPGTTGWEVLQSMYEDPQLATVPVIVLTSLDSRDGLPVGPPTLHKPVDPEVLLDLAHVLLERHDALVAGATGGHGRGHA